MKANRTQLAEILGKSMVTITTWLGEGMPYVEGGGKGKPFVFETSECIEWAVENGKYRPKKRAPVPGADPFAEGGDAPETYEEAERRQKVAQADKAELELAKAAGLVVPVDEVAFVVTEENARVRARLLAIPNDIRMRVRSYFGGDRELEESVVGGVEAAILDAMTEVRDPGAASDGDAGGE